MKFHMNDQKIFGSTLQQLTPDQQTCKQLNIIYDA